MATCHMQLRPLLEKSRDIIINQIKSNQGFWLQHSTILPSPHIFFFSLLIGASKMIGQYCNHRMPFLVVSPFSSYVIHSDHY